MPRSTAAMIGSTCKCSSVQMMAAVTSGRLSSSMWLCVTKSALIFGPTSPARFGFFSASPIHWTAGWRAATSPRNNPTRPPPIIARPTPLAEAFIGSPRTDFLLELGNGRDRFVGQRQIHRLVSIGRQVCSAVGLHHTPRAFRRYHHRGVADAGLQEMDGFRAHAASKDVGDPLTRHGGHRKLLTALLGIEPVVALGVIEKQ